MNQTKTQINALGLLNAIKCGAITINSWSTAEGQKILQAAAYGKQIIVDGEPIPLENEIFFNLSPNRYAVKGDTVKVVLNGSEYEIDIQKVIDGGYLKKVS